MSFYSLHKIKNILASRWKLIEVECADTPHIIYAGDLFDYSIIYEQRGKRRLRQIHLISRGEREKKKQKPWLRFGKANRMSEVFDLLKGCFRLARCLRQKRLQE